MKETKLKQVFVFVLIIVGSMSLVRNALLYVFGMGELLPPLEGQISALGIFMLTAFVVWIMDQ